jgi:hypothetical protein
VGTILDEAASPSSVSRACKFGRWVGSQPEALRAEIAEALPAPDVSNKALWRVLRRRGFDGTAECLRLHRVGECRCQ